MHDPWVYVSPNPFCARVAHVLLSNAAVAAAGDCGSTPSALPVPVDTAPRYLLRDGDGIYGEWVARRIEGLGIDEVVTAPGSPWQNAYADTDDIETDHLSEAIQHRNVGRYRSS